MAEAFDWVVAGRRRRAQPGEEPKVIYCVAHEHQPFVRLLLSLGLSLGAVRQQDGERLCLGVVCRNEGQAKRHTMRIMRALVARPQLLLDLTLGDWRARRVNDTRLLLYWRGIEVEAVPLH